MWITDDPRFTSCKPCKTYDIKGGIDLRFGLILPIMATQQQKAHLDPFTTAAQASNDASPQSKVEILDKILKPAQFCMLTTVAPDMSELHSRCMYPASTEHLRFQFIANNVSYKFEELKGNNLVHLSFFDAKSTSWASITGRANVTRDLELVKKLWSPR